MISSALHTEPPLTLITAENPPVTKTALSGEERNRKSMDLDEWELLPIDGFLDFGEGCEKKVKAVPGKRRAADSTTTFINVDLDYFRCPPPPPASSKLSPPPQLVPVRIQLDPPVKEDPGGGSEMKIVAPPSEGAAADQDPVSQVFFKKLKENEFVDMKILESPRSGSRPMSPPIDNFRFEDKSEIILEGSRSPRRVPEKHGGEVAGRRAEANGGGMNIWKWSLTGIGALCSFGVAAATICTILIIGSHQKNKQNHQKIKFQIYTDDKRIKQVIHHASKLNEAISAARGVPLTRAQITIGGHYEGL